MTPPRHLWSGDWRHDSEEDARRRHEEAERAAREAREARAAAPAAIRPQAPPTEAAPLSGGAARRRIAAGAAAAVLAIGAGAFTAGALLDDDGASTNGVAQSTELPATASKPVTPKRGQTRAGTIYAQASPAVVSIRAGSGSGTGFMVDNDGTLVTNDHVVDNATRVQVRFGTEGRVIEGRVRGTDPSSDLAVVHIDPDDAPADAKPLTFADSDAVSVGDIAIAIGNPFGLDRTATEGIVSSLGRTIQAPNGFQIDDVIQTDAAINPGNSGGPLLDDGGLVVGVTSQIATSGGTGGNVGIGFAVPSNTVRRSIPGLKQGLTVSHAWLGVQIGPAGSALGGSGNPSASGAEISSITTGGPADDAGLRVGDIVKSIDGKRIDDSTDLSSAINAKAVGDRISMVVERDGRTETIEVELEDRPAGGTP